MARPHTINPAPSVHVDSFWTGYVQLSNGSYVSACTFMSQASSARVVVETLEILSQHFSAFCFKWRPIQLPPSRVAVTISLHWRAANSFQWRASVCVCVESLRPNAANEKFQTSWFGVGMVSVGSVEWHFWQTFPCDVFLYVYKLCSISRNQLRGGNYLRFDGGRATIHSQCVHCPVSEKPNSEIEIHDECVIIHDIAA